MRQKDREKLLQSKYANLQEEIKILNEIQTNSDQ